MELNDIKCLILTDSGKLNTNYKIILNKHNDIIDYLYNYYNCDNLSECVYRLRNNIINPPICPICNKQIHFNGKFYSKTCSPSCGSKLANVKIKQTKFERYGDVNYNNRVKCKLTKIMHYGDANYVNTEKAKQTKLERYGDANYVNPEKAKQTNLNRYGDANYNNIEKIKQTKLKRYGDANYVNPEKAKQTNLIKYGVSCTLHNNCIKQKVIETNRQKYGANYFVQSIYWQNIIKNKDWQTHRKLAEYITKRKNSTFNVSKPENKCYELLCSKFGSDNIIRQYKSDLYPYCCDFYIKNNDIIGHDLYIECNFHWTHNDHLYNKNNIKDIITKCRWNQKAKTSKFYFNAIKTWTERDVKKHNIAKMNHLNWLCFYKKSDFDEFLNSIKLN